MICCRVLSLDTALFEEIRGNADTIAGLVLEMNGKMPHKGQQIEVAGLQMQIKNVTKRRIEKIQITLK